MANVADAVSQVIRWVINLAPFGILGLVFSAVSTSGSSTAELPLAPMRVGM